MRCSTRPSEHWPMIACSRRSPTARWFYFEQAVALAPDHELAQEGFERIVERYLALATRAIERERWASARSMLDRARLVDADHVGIGALRRQVELLSNARRVVLDLNQTEVRNRRLGTVAKLTAFGLLARDPAARVTILAGSDADGRWMYEQLNKAPGSPRIRGRASRSASRPRLRFCFWASPSEPKMVFGGECRGSGIWFGPCRGHLRQRLDSRRAPR